MTQMTTRRRTADGPVIRSAEADEGASETVLLLNPWPESLFAWETIWSRLAQTAQLVAIDLPGFGQSERRADLLSWARRRDRCRAVRGSRGRRPVPQRRRRQRRRVIPAFLHARLAHSKLDILETGHFAWEDGADEYLELTRSWIAAHSLDLS